MKKKKVEVFMENNEETLRRWIHEAYGTNKEIISAVRGEAIEMDMKINWIKINGRRVAKNLNY